MVCTACGCEQGGPAQFCRQCGTSLQAAAPPPQPGWAPASFPPYRMAPRLRVQQNLQPLGILWCVFGAYRVLGGIAAAFAVHAIAHSGMFGDAPPFVAHLIGSVGPFVMVVSLFMGVLDVLTGYSLLTRQPWARILAIVMAILSLIKLPFGTALGIYTLWVLAPQTSSLEWEAMAPSRA